MKQFLTAFILLFSTIPAMAQLPVEGTDYVDLGLRSGNCDVGLWTRELK